MHPLLVKEDGEGNPESVELYGKNFTTAEIQLLQEEHSGVSTYSIFKAVDAKTRNCGYGWVTDMPDSNGDSYTGQVDENNLKSGVGVLLPVWPESGNDTIGYQYSTWESDVKNGFTYYEEDD